jgi:hypothetical protein
MLEPIADNTKTASSLVTRQLALATSFARLAGVASSTSSAPPGVPPYSAPIPSASAMLNMNNKAQALAVTLYAARMIQSDTGSHLGPLASNRINLLA